MDEDWDDEFGDQEFDDGDWSNEDELTDVVRCPACGADVYEDAEQCPSCGEYIVHDTNIWNGKSVWWILLGLAGIIAVVMTLSGLAG